MKLVSTKADYGDVADEIYRLRTEKQNAQLAIATEMNSIKEYLI